MAARDSQRNQERQADVGATMIRRLRGNEWAVLITLSLGFFMTLLDLTIVNVAIPDMTAKLHASLDEVGWVINAYIIVLTVLLITSGRLGDLRGRRNIFAAGVALFTIASAACGVSQTAGELIAARAAQGLGAAMLLPQTMAIIIATFPASRRGTALGIWGSVGGLAAITGPTVGGMLVTWLGWRWIFFVNLPVGALVLALLAVGIIPDSRAGHRQPLDLPGVLLASGALIAITYGLVEGQRYDWGEVWSFVTIPLLIGAGAALLALFVFFQARRQARQPLVPFALFADRNYTLMSAANVIVSIGLIGMALPMTIYLQSVLGFSALKAGLTMAPAAFVSMFVAPVGGRLADRGGKYVLMLGLGLYAAGMTWNIAVASAGSRWYEFLPGFVLAGFGIGCTFAPMQTIATRNVQPRMAGAAAGVLQTVRQFGSALAGAVTLAILQNRLAAAMASQAAARVTQIPPRARGTFVAAFRHAATNGIEVGAGQNGAARTVPQGSSPQVVRQIAEAGHQVFAHGFIDAMRPTLAIPIGAMLVGVLLCLAVRDTPAQAAGQPPEGNKFRNETVPYR
jgi:EmrB/QacA subfamily drug resistance transporter